MTKNSRLKNHLIVTTALVGVFLGYGRRAYAVPCGTATPPNYLCSGYYTSSITLNANNAAVTTASGFGVNAAAGNAITITGDGAISFTDVDNSSIIGGDTGLTVWALADDMGTPGSIFISTNGSITGTNILGINARNLGTGALSITAEGDVSGGQRGIYASNSGTDLSVTTMAGSSITGTNQYGIYARNGGTGALTITADGDVTGGYRGIYVTNSGTDLSVTTGVGSSITGTSNFGIVAVNQGTGALTITADGDVIGGNLGIYALNNGTGTDLSVTTGASSSINGISNYGIRADNNGTGSITITADGAVSGGISGLFARNFGSSTDLTVTTGASSIITGTSGYGIYANNQGTGVLSITADGDVSGGDLGIYALNTGTDISVNTGVGSAATGISRYGILARNYGAGTLTITAEGDVSGGQRGIFVRNSGTDLSVTTGVGSTITGTNNEGIYANNNGTGALTITADGDVTGYTSGIYARNYGTDLSISTGAGSAITGTIQYGILARNFGTGALSITADGDVSGGDRGIYARNDGAGTDLSVITGVGSIITGTSRYGIYARNDGTGALTITNAGTVSGNSGIFVVGNGALAGSITNEATGTIQGTGGTAISLNNLTSALSININGGHIIGDVIDSAAGNGFSSVNIAGDFTSEGNFNVSDFNVSTGKEFTFGAGKTITSQNAVDTNGEIIVSAAGSSITGDLNVNAGGILTSNANFSISGGLANNGTVSIVNGTLSADTMTAGTGSFLFGVTSSATHGLLQINSSAFDLTGSSVSVNVALANTLLNGDEIRIVNGSGVVIGGPGNTPATITDNSAFWDFQLVDGTAVGSPTNNSDLFVIATAVTGLPSWGLLVDGASNLSGGVNNSGVLAGTIGGIGVLTASDISGGVTNSGTLTGLQFGIRVRSGSDISGGVNNSGFINGGDYGISVTATSDISGGIFNQAGGTIAGGVTGIFVATGSQLSGGIHNDGTIIGGTNGITFTNTGSNLTIVTGAGTTTTGTSQLGIQALNYGTGTLSITADGDVNGGNFGIYARNNGAGTDLTVSTGAGSTIIGTGQSGIYAFNNGTGALTITADGDVSGGNRGIFARNYGTGTDLSVVTGVGSTITGTSQYGIFVRNYGTGAMNITADGEVTAGNRGILALNQGAGTDLSVTTGAGSSITGTNGFGIYALNLGTGSLSITLDGDVNSDNSGILARNYGTGTDLSVTTGVGSTITGTGQYGIYAINDGTGALTITNSGTVSGNTGISVNRNGNIAGSITNEATGTIRGTGGTAISLNNLNSALAININGGHIIGDVIDNNSGNGFSTVNIADNFTSQGSFSVSKVSISKDARFTLGAGNSLSTSTLNFDVASLASHGSMVVTGAAANLSGTSLTVKRVAGGILQDGDEMRIINGQGTIIGGPGGTPQSVTDNSILWDFSIVDGTAAGTDDSDLFLQVSRINTAGLFGLLVEGTDQVAPVVVGGTSTLNGAWGGIGVFSGDISGGVTNSGTISGGKWGILVASGSDISGAVLNNGTISGATTGIRVQGTSTLSGGIVNNGNITGGTYGISFTNDIIGSTSLTISGSGSIVGSTKGINILNNGGDFTLTAGGPGSSITGTSGLGIAALNNGTGALNITADGDVTGDQGGIYAVNNGTGTDLSVTTGAGTAITGTNNLGLAAVNNGTGLISITADGNVAGLNYGIATVNTATGTDITITTGVGSSITGTNNYGIYARNNGTGALTITADGDVTSGNRGIYARNYGTDLSVTTGVGSSITGTSSYGILARNNGTGSFSITADGDVTGACSGIYARNYAMGTDFSVTTGVGSSITGTNYYGISVSNYGTGALSITADGDVTGGYRGILALNYGTGPLTITADGDVTGGNHGIFTRNSGTGTDLTVTTGVGSTITGTNQYGIYAQNYGTGGLTITADGDVTGDQRGIYARNNGTDLSVTTGAGSSITGTNNYGIYARNNGTGALTITADGDVTGGSRGILARNYGTDLSVTIGASSSINSTNSYGIYALNNGTGALTITADGDVTGDPGGIFTRNSGTGTDLTITTGVGSSITGTNSYGIHAINDGTGSLSVTNAGTVNSIIGIRVSQNGAMAGGITNETTGTIEGTGGTAISLYNLTTALSININGGHIIGDVVDNNAGNGFSSVNIAQDFTSEGNFSVSNFSIAAGKTFTFGAGKTITSQNAVDTNGEIIVSAAGSAITGDLNINTGGILTDNADFSISGALTNDGTVTIATGKTLTAATMGAGTGTLTFGVTSLADHAQLTLTSGAANLTGQAITIDVAGVNSILATDQFKLIDGVGAIVGGPGATATAVTDNSFLWDFEILDGTAAGTPTDSSDLFLRITQNVVPPGTMFETTNNENSFSTLSLLQGNTANPELLDVLANLNGAPDEQSFNEVLEAVQPAMDGGAIGAVLDVTSNALDLTGSRLEDLNGGYNIGGYESGFTEGTTTQPTSLVWATSFGDDRGIGFGDTYLSGSKEWQQIFGQTSRQGRRDGIEGYSAHTVGGAFGADTGNVFNNGTIGIAFSYATTQVDSKNANSAKTDIDSYQATLYGDHKLGEEGYLSGMAAYVWNNNDTARFNVGGTPGLTARGNFDSSQMALRAEVGQHINVGSYTITPNARLNYTHYTADDYTETGAGGANLNVKTQSLDSLEAGLGAKVSTMFKIKNSESAVIPSVQVGYRYGVISDPIEMSSAFTGGGASFQTEGAEPAKHRFNFGTTAKYIVNEQWDLTASYTFDYKEDYTAHAGFLRVSYKF